MIKAKHQIVLLSAYLFPQEVFLKPIRLLPSPLHAFVAQARFLFDKSVIKDPSGRSFTVKLVKLSVFEIVLPWDCDFPFSPRLDK